MHECHCCQPPFLYRDFTSQSIGKDETDGRYGDVSIEKCNNCGSSWLRYFVEYEAFSKSGRWFRAPMSPESTATITPEKAIDYINQQPWYFAGGSYFQSEGFRTTGVARVNI